MKNATAQNKIAQGHLRSTLKTNDAEVAAFHAEYAIHSAYEARTQANSAMNHGLLPNHPQFNAADAHATEAARHAEAAEQAAVAAKKHAASLRATESARPKTGDSADAGYFPVGHKSDYEEPNHELIKQDSFIPGDHNTHRDNDSTSTYLEVRSNRTNAEHSQGAQEPKESDYFIPK